MKQWLRNFLVRKLYARLQDAAQSSANWQQTASLTQAESLAEQLMQ